MPGSGTAAPGASSSGVAGPDGSAPDGAGAVDAPGPDGADVGGPDSAEAVGGCVGSAGGVMVVVGSALPVGSGSDSVGSVGSVGSGVLGVSGCRVRSAAGELRVVREAPELVSSGSGRIWR